MENGVEFDMAEPTIDELVVYVPAKDFEISQRFYKALGFTLTPAWGGTFDCRLDSGVFRLQDYYVKDWADNFMIKMDVASVDDWHERVKSVFAAEDLRPARFSPPEMASVDTKIMHVVDPSGVLLIFVER